MSYVSVTEWQHEPGPFHGDEIMNSKALAFQSLCSAQWPTALNTQPTITSNYGDEDSKPALGHKSANQATTRNCSRFRKWGWNWQRRGDKCNCPAADQQKTVTGVKTCHTATIAAGQPLPFLKIKILLTPFYNLVITSVHRVGIMSLVSDEKCQWTTPEQENAINLCTPTILSDDRSTNRSIKVWPYIPIWQISYWCYDMLRMVMVCQCENMEPVSL